jgi:hypothetical protein
VRGAEGILDTRPPTKLPRAWTTGPPWLPRAVGFPVGNPQRPSIPPSRSRSAVYEWRVTRSELRRGRAMADVDTATKAST